MTEIKEIKEITAEEFLTLGSVKENVPYDVPGMGRVYIKKITNLEFQQWAKNKDEDMDLYSDGSLIQLCVVNSSGQHLFKLDQVTRLVSVQQSIVVKLIKKCLKINGIGRDAEKEIEKNSEPMPVKGS